MLIYRYFAILGVGVALASCHAEPMKPGTSKDTRSRSGVVEPSLARNANNPAKSQTAPRIVALSVQKPAIVPPKGNEQDKPAAEIETPGNVPSMSEHLEQPQNTESPAEAKDQSKPVVSPPASPAPLAILKTVKLAPEIQLAAPIRSTNASGDSKTEEVVSKKPDDGKLNKQWDFLAVFSPSLGNLRFNSGVSQQANRQNHNNLFWSPVAAEPNQSLATLTSNLRGWGDGEMGIGGDGGSANLPSPPLPFAKAPVNPSVPQPLTPSSPSIPIFPSQPSNADQTLLAQSTTPGNSQPRRENSERNAPEFLNPSPNPLLFPTESREVQVRGIQPITLEQAIELARRNNRDLQATQLELRRVRAQLQEALAAEFPLIGVEAQLNRDEGDLSAQQTQSAIAAGLDPNDLRISTTLSGSLQVNYDLFTAGRRSGQIRTAEEQVRIQQLEVERISEELRLNTTGAYYDLQGADAQVEIARAAVADATQSVRDARLREQAGLGTRFEVLQAEVTLANARQDLTRALSQQQIARRQIVQLLSLSQQVEVSAADPIEVAGEWNLSLEQSIVLAYKNRAELEQLLAQRNIGEQQRRVALAANKPQVTLSASYGLSNELGEETGTPDSFRLGAGVRWDFFDGGAARARAEQAEQDIAIAETNFANQRNQIRLGVEQAFYDLRANAENIQTASFALATAQESLRLARLRFQAGVGTQTDVINQQTELTRARGNRLTAILDYNRALADLQRSVSNLPDGELFDLP